MVSEIRGLLRSGEARLADAANRALSLESRFDLAYNAAHALALAALRLRGYRSENRFLVFQVLPHTLGLPPATWRVGLPTLTPGLREAPGLEGQWQPTSWITSSLCS